MRPWTLHPESASDLNPLLTDLARVHDDTTAESASAQVPSSSVRVRIWKKRRVEATGHSMATPTADRSTAASYPTSRRPDALAWKHYIQGGVVSSLNKRFVTNSMMATAGKVTEDEDNETDSEEEATAVPTTHAGSLQLIERTLQGIAACSQEDGERGVGRYAKTILLGRSIWASEALRPDETRGLHEDIFGEDASPPCREVAKPRLPPVRSRENA